MNEERVVELNKFKKRVIENGWRMYRSNFSHSDLNNIYK